MGIILPPVVRKGSTRLRLSLLAGVLALAGACVDLGVPEGLQPAASNSNNSARDPSHVAPDGGLQGSDAPLEASPALVEGGGEQGGSRPDGGPSKDGALALEGGKCTTGAACASGFCADGV